MKTLKIIITLVAFFSISVINVALYTNKKQKEQIMSAVAGYTILVDPGHGGKDNGTSYEDVMEDEINLLIATKVYEHLLDAGARTLISRIADYDLSDVYAKNHKIQDLNKRISYIKENDVDLFLSIHLNSYSSNNVSGAQVFYKTKNSENELFASTMQNTLNQLNKKDKKPKVGDYYLLNNTGQINGIIIECGFLSNTEERKKLVTDAYQNKIAKLIEEGIINFLKIKNSI